MTLWSRELGRAEVDSASALDVPPCVGAERSLQFVIDGHAFFAVADDEDSAVNNGLCVAQGAMCVGRIHSDGGDFLIYQSVQLRERGPSPVDILTPRELQVASLIAEGRCDKEIARQLGISGYTVREHIRRIFAKLNLSRRSAVVAYILGDRDRLRPALGRTA